MKFTKYLSYFLVVGVLVCTSQVFAADMSGVPMKHPDGAVANCMACHDGVVPKSKPASEKCVSCHGPMKDIKVAENPQGKNPHNSDHYGDTIDCMACHSEHKPSKAVCNNCHVVEFKNLK